MLIVASLAGAAVFFYLDLGRLESATVAVATLALLALYQTVSSRFGLRSAVGRQLADLSRGGADVGRQVAEMGRRLAALESKFESVTDQARSVTDPLSVQLSELNARMMRLTEIVGVHQTTADASANSAFEQPAKAAASTKPPVSFSDSAAQASAGVSLESIRSAIDASRIELYLQPIVTLPRRKVCFYEATSRLRSESGDTAGQAEFIPQAERGGLMPEIDHLVIFRCVQIVRRLVMKNRDIGVFCSVSRTTLADAGFSQQLHDFMAANRAIAASLILQFTQSAVREMAEKEFARVAALAELGFRFCLDAVTALRLKPEELAPRGFRYIKLHAALFLGSAGSVPSPGGREELSDLLARYGLDLIVDEIDNESSVMELLDHDIRYGQGPLFSPPRPVRAEALQVASNMPDSVVEGLPANRPLSPELRPRALPAEPQTSEQGGNGELRGGALRLG